MKFKVTLVAALAAIFLVTACTPSKDWKDPKWIAYAMKHNSAKSFHAYMNLDDAQRKELLPDVIDAYNHNRNQENAVRALLTVQDDRTVDIYKNALERADDDLALLGARGLVKQGVSGASDMIADRLQTVTKSKDFLGFVQALQKDPTQKAIAVVAKLAQRPAPKIGGVPTVRAACDIMGHANKVTDELIRGIAVGMVNFTAQPHDDPLHTCEMAALKHQKALIPAIVKIYKGDNQRVNDLVKAQGFSIASGKLRGAMVLGHLRNDKANDAIRDWLKADHPVPAAQLSAMDTQAQMHWYDNHGQLYTISVKSLSYERNPKDAELLRQLIVSDGKLLHNFRDWFGLSSGAEVNLRQAAASALAAVGTPAKTRKLLWEQATNGTVNRDPTKRNSTLYHLNTIHAIGRIAGKDGLRNFKKAFNAQPEKWQHEFRALYGYFVLSDACGDDIACRKKYVLDPAPLMARDDVKAWIASAKEEKQEALTKQLTQAIEAGGVWQIAILGGDAAASDMLVDILKDGPDVARNAVPEALLYCREWSPNVSTDVYQWLDKTKDAHGVAGWEKLRELAETVAYLAKQ